MPPKHPKRGWKVEPVGLILGTERRDFSSVRWEHHLPIPPRGRTPTRPVRRRGGGLEFISNLRGKVGQSRRLPLTSHPRRALTSATHTKNKKEKTKAPRAFRATSPALPMARWLSRPPLLPAATGCRGDLCCSGPPPSRACQRAPPPRYLLSAGREGQSERGDPQAGRRAPERPRGSGPEGARPGGARAGYSPGAAPALPAAGPLAGPRGPRQARSRPLLCVRKTEPPRRAEEPGAPWWRNKTFFFLFFGVLFLKCKFPY